MLVVLVRHGIASPVGVDGARSDAERGLSPEGLEKTREAARGLATLLDAPPTVIASPLRRAQETAVVVAQALHAPPPRTNPALALGGPYEEILADPALAAPKGDVVLVGHQPSLEALASWLLTGEPDVRIEVKKASALAIGYPGVPRRGGGTLCWFLPPRVLRGLES
ncbi:MAG: histidine phosphatase family protein [Planctomycetes bacterium]|nr:histidine phosphatase family protein [Planctomycetota bacterium]MCB9825464.1 histidine phosphatase family protein [Planctomycetota bacterium]MCB9829508.1 histidine phosphatase family protein [Planctomycetota bacterium]MCB9900558.1 histidine phosphatase family protein [Planctomycetota bacterium]